MIGGEDGIHMAGQQDANRRFRAYRSDQMPAVLYLIDRAVRADHLDGFGVDQAGLSRQDRKGLCEHSRDGRQAIKIGGAAIDLRPFKRARQ